jgi:hypothetical protein
LVGRSHNLGCGACERLAQSASEEWNKPGNPASHFVCVQSVVVDDQDNLWILDLAAPKMQQIIKGGPTRTEPHKLWKITGL